LTSQFLAIEPEQRSCALGQVGVVIVSSRTGAHSLRATKGTKAICADAAALMQVNASALSALKGCCPRPLNAQMHRVD
jgi:hypothetical protein